MLRIEAILNIVNNARDGIEERHSRETDVDSCVRIATRANAGGSAVSITVTDRGAGIKKELLERVFEPFFTTKSPERGTGLGLSVSRNIVREYGGDVCISSTEGRGTTVRIILPAAGHSAPASSPDRSNSTQSGQ